MVAPLYIAYHSNDDPMEYWQQGLEMLLPDIRLVAPDAPEAQKAEVIITWDPPEGTIAGLPSLKGVISLAQGVDHILKDPAFPRHLKFARLIDPYMSEAMAEWVLLSILEKHRDSEIYREASTRKEWIRLRPRVAADTCVAVMGLGAIGSHVAEKVAMMGFRTIGWARSSKSIPGVTAHTGDEGFSTCLEEADFVVSILPLTEETRDLFNAQTFAKMKNGAFFINSGRGLQVVEDDLIKAIDKGHLSGATLDVTRIEPLPKESPLWEHPHICIWPHVSAQTNADTAAHQVADAILAIRSGKDPENVVNVDRGY
ncbi:2-hydroxyacid dehydrogenase [Alphaproteobacteria bacterium LSUCC0684]